MSDNITSITRRHRRRDFLTNGAAAAAVLTAGIGTARSAPSSTVADPIIDLIRREEEIRNAGVTLQDKAFVLERDATDEQLADPVFLAEIEALDARSNALVEQAGELLDEIDTVIPMTIAGAIALIESTAVEYGDVAVQNALTGLRAIAADGGGAA